MNNLFMLIMFAGTFFSAVSQVLLKQSARQTHTGRFGEYLNRRVIAAYLIFGAVLLANTYAYTRVEMKYGAVIDTFTYVFVMLLSVLVLKEKVTRGRLAGNLIIMAGVVIYTLPGR